MVFGTLHLKTSHIVLLFGLALLLTTILFLLVLTHLGIPLATETGTQLADLPSLIMPPGGAGVSSNSWYYGS